MGQAFKKQWVFWGALILGTWGPEPSQFSENWTFYLRLPSTTTLTALKHLLLFLLCSLSRNIFIIFRSYLPTSILLLSLPQQFLNFKQEGKMSFFLLCPLSQHVHLPWHWNHLQTRNGTSTLQPKANTAPGEGERQRHLNLGSPMGQTEPLFWKPWSSSLV